MKVRSRIRGFTIEADLLAEKERDSFVVPDGMRGDMILYFKMKRDEEVVDEEIVVFDVKRMDVMGEEMLVYEARKNAFGEEIPLGSFALCSRCGMPVYTSAHPDLNLGFSHWVSRNGELTDKEIEGEVVFCPKCEKRLKTS